MLNKIHPGLTGLLFLLAMAGSAVATPAQTTEDVWAHHIAAWEARDLEGIAADYDEESVLILNNEIFRGRHEIKGVFVRLFATFDNGTNRIDTPVVDGRIVYITWHFTPNGSDEFFGTDTFVIEDGTINVQTIASPLYDVVDAVR